LPAVSTGEGDGRGIDLQACLLRFSADPADHEAALLGACDDVLGTELVRSLSTARYTIVGRPRSVANPDALTTPVVYIYLDRLQTGCSEKENAGGLRGSGCCLLNEHDFQVLIEELMMKWNVGTARVARVRASLVCVYGPKSSVDRIANSARAVATDIRYGAPLSPLIDIWDGDFDELAGAALVMVTGRVNEKGGCYRPQRCGGPVEASRHQPCIYKNPDPTCS